MICPRCAFEQRDELKFCKSCVGATLAFQKVCKSDGGTTQLGLGMTWQGLTSSR